MLNGVNRAFEVASGRLVEFREQFLLFAQGKGLSVAARTMQEHVVCVPRSEQN